jgi:hypothetical protein
MTGWSWWTAAQTAVVMSLCMAPLLAEPWATVAVRNLPIRRRCSMACFTAGFLAFWVSASLILLVVAHAVGVHGSASAFAGACTVGIWWQLSHRRLRWASRCGYVRTARLRGWGSTVDHWRSGWLFAGRCGRSCWAAMLMMVAAPTMLMMAFVASMMLWEFRRGPNPFAATRRRAPAAWYGVLAVLSVAVSLT